MMIMLMIHTCVAELRKFPAWKSKLFKGWNDATALVYMCVCV